MGVTVTMYRDKVYRQFSPKPPFIATTMLGSIVLTLQIVSLLGSIICLINANEIIFQRELVPRFYSKISVYWLEVARSLSFHFILAVIVQTLLLPVTIGLIVGVAKKSQWFMLPWLVIFGVAVPCGIVGSILCLTRIPSRNPLDNDFYNFIHGLVSLTILLVTVFIIYPTWHLSLHVFSYLCSQELYSINNRRDYLFKYFYS